MNQKKENFESNKLKVNISGYEGPLDLLLDLSKRQKVDITKVSILELAEQYLNFINENIYDLNLTADYLVMASFLAYLKSKLLLPKDQVESDEISEEELTRKLVQYNAIKQAGVKIFELPQENIDFFTRKSKNEFFISNKIVINTSLNDLINNYFLIYKKNNEAIFKIKKNNYFSIEDGIKWIKTIFSIEENLWRDLIDFLPESFENNKMRKSAIISLVLASLSYAKDGDINLSQKKTYDKIFIKSKLT